MKHIGTWLRWVCKAVLLVLVLVAGLAVGTARYRDSGLYPPGPDERFHAIAIADHGVHTGIVFAREDLDAAAMALADPVLSAIVQRYSAYPFIEVGWGDEQFYRFVPTWSDVSFSMAARALLGLDSATVLHVVGLDQDAKATFTRSDVQVLQLSDAGFERLIRRFSATFALSSDRQPIELGQGIYGPSLFYRANAHYSLVHTCNHWIADMLADAGLAVSPVPAVLSGGLLAELRLRNPLGSVDHGAFQIGQPK